MFTRWKTIDGKKRQYLVESYRDEKGRPRQRHIAYVDLWPDADIEKLKQLYAAYAKALKHANNTSNGKAYQQHAVGIAAKCQQDIVTFKGVMERKLRKIRYYSDGRFGSDKNKNHNSPKLGVLLRDPYVFFSKLHTRAAYQSRFLQAQVKLFQSNPQLMGGNPNYGGFALLKNFEPGRYAEMKQKIQGVAAARAQELATLRQLLRKLS